MKNKITSLLFLIFLAGFIIRTFPLETGFHDWDETVYLQHAEIMSGNRPMDNFNELWFRPPLLPLLFAAGYLLNDSIIMLHLIVSFLSSLCVIAIFFLARELFNNEEMALLSSLIFAFIPLHISLSHELLVDSILPLFFILTVFFSYKANKEPRYGFIAGIFMGLAILLKFTSLILMLFVVLIFILSGKYKSKGLRIKYVTGYIFDTLLSTKVTYLLLSCLVVLMPYLAWSYLSYGSPFATFAYANWIVNLDFPTDNLLFISSFPILFPAVFTFGIIIFLVMAAMERRLSKHDSSLLLFILILFLFVLMLVHKEIRFLMPVLPFLSILSARGFISLRSIIGEKILWITLIIILLSIFIQTLPQTSFDIFTQRNSAVMDAGIWIRDNLPENITVYSNYQYPPIAYYSDRRLVILSFFNYTHDKIGEFLEGDAYVVTSTLTTIEPQPELFINDSRFALVKTFADDKEIIYVFSYKNSID